MLRERGVVGKFVEFYGPGLPTLALADRATIGNMSPEYGATCAIFPVDAETLRYLEFTGRADRGDRAGRRLRPRAGAVPRRRTPRTPTFTDTLELDLGDVVPSIAGPKRPQDRIALSDAKDAFFETLRSFDDRRRRATLGTRPIAESFPASDPPGNGSGTAAGSPTTKPSGAAAATAAPRSAAPTTRSRSPTPTATSSSSTTAASSSPRSRAARTPRTRR